MGPQQAISGIQGAFLNLKVQIHGWVIPANLNGSVRQIKSISFDIDPKLSINISVFTYTDNKNRDLYYKT